MVIPPRRLALIVRLAVACIVVSAALTVSTRAATDQWAEEFKTPFTGQIINTLNGNPVGGPTFTGAALQTVAGLHVGDPILIDGSNGRQYSATVQTITPQTHQITWTPALPVNAQLNQFVRATYALSYPKQSAIDAAGNVYTTDTGNNRIVVFDPHGRMLWTLGHYGRVYSNAVTGGPIITGLGWDGWDDCSSEPQPCPNNPQQMLGQFYSPDGIDVSPDGSTIVVADQWNDRIQVFTLNAGGAIHADAGAIAGPRFDAYAIGAFGATHDSVTAGPGQMYGPNGVSFDPATGRIIVAEQYNERIQIFTPAGGHNYIATAIGSQGSSLPPSGPLTFLYPEDVEFDHSSNPQTAGRIIVTDSGNDRVIVLSSSGQFVCEIGDVGTTELYDPRGVTIDDAGRIYIADLRHSQIKVYTPAGASAYALENAFGAQQTTSPVPGELLFISPTGVAIRGGRLIITEQGGQRLQYLTRSGIAIDSVDVDQSSLIVQDAAHDRLHVTVTARNTGAVDLTNLSLAITPSYAGTLSPVTSSSTVLEAAGGADTVRYEFDFTVTGAAVDGSGFAHTLLFKLQAAAASGNVSVTSALQDFDTGVTVSRPTNAAIALGAIVVGTIRPGRAGIREQITITAPVANVGTGTLHDVMATVTAVSSTASAVLPASATSPASGGLTLAESASASLPFTFVASAVGTVRFNVHVTAKDAAGHAIATDDVLVPDAPGVQIVQDNVAPAVTVGISPLPHATTADGLRWHNSFPTLNVMAVDTNGGVGVTELHWRMLTTSSQHPSDEVGVCTLTGADVFPSSCTPFGSGPTATLTWTRNMSPMHGTVVIAFWAVDSAGNGVVADETNCSLVTCITLHIDVDPPSLQPGVPVFNANNTAVSIPFVTTDDISHVGSITSPNTLQMQSISSGTLVLAAEGAAVFGSVTVTDYAGNSVTYAVPLAGPGSPVIRLDHTPPEAFNQLDASALGGRCTTTIAGRPVSYFCTNKVYGTDNLPGLTASAFAPILVIPVRWGGGFDGDDDDDDDHDWDGGTAEYHVYRFTDEFTPAQGPPPTQNPNQVTLIEKVRQSGNEARVHVLAFQYRQGSVLKPLVIPDWAVKKYEWATNKDGSLKSLNQKFELHKGPDRDQVEASFDTKSGVTTIKRLGRHSSREQVRGLILLTMTTDHGELKIKYDLNAPVPLPDVAPPELTLPSSISVNATTTAGVPVSFTVSALDAVDGVRPVSCSATSGTIFPIGTTTVTCSASDTSGNTATGSFAIAVKKKK